MSQECPIHENYKLALLKAKDSDTTVTGRSIGGPVRVLKNKMAREYLALESRGASLEELERRTLGGLRRAVFDGDVVTGGVVTGQVAGMLHEIRPLRAIFQELYTQGQAVLRTTRDVWGGSRHEAGFFVCRTGAVSTRGWDRICTKPIPPSGPSWTGRMWAST